MGFGVFLAVYVCFSVKITRPVKTFAEISDDTQLVCEYVFILKYECYLSKLELVAEKALAYSKFLARFQNHSALQKFSLTLYLFVIGLDRPAPFLNLVILSRCQEPGPMAAELFRSQKG